MALGDQVEALRQQVAKLETAVALLNREAGATAGELGAVYDTCQSHTTDIAVLKAELAENRREIEELKRERDELRKWLRGLVASFIVLAAGVALAMLGLKPR